MFIGQLQQNNAMSPFVLKGPQEQKRGCTEWKYEKHLEGLRQAQQLEAEEKSPLELMIERLQQAENGELKTDAKTVVSLPGIMSI